MLFALDDLAVVLGMALGFVVALVVHALVQCALAQSAGDLAPQLAGRRSLDPRRHLDAFGVVALVLAGLGWPKPVPLTEPRGARRNRYLLTVLSGPLTLVALGLGAIAALVATGLDGAGAGIALGSSWTLRMAFWAALTVLRIGVLLLIPLPPFDGARVMWALAPRTEGWRRARYQLEENNVGLAIALALSLPLFGGTGLLVRAVDAVVEPLLRLVLG